MTIPRRLLPLLALAAAPAAAQAQVLPATRAPQPTTAAISTGDLMSRLYAISADSMGGREAGTPANLKGTAYIARELQRIGLQPAGDNGTFFQDVPLVKRTFVESRPLTLGGAALAPWTDYAPRDQGAGTRSVDGARVIFGGTWGDEASLVSDADAAGKVVLLLPRRGPNGQPMWQVTRNQVSARFPSAAAIAFASMDILPAPILASYREAPVDLKSDEPSEPAPAWVYVTPAVARRMMNGAALESATRGQAGATLGGAVVFQDTPVPGRNVVAVLRGSDPRLRGEYVAIGAHNDHVGTTVRPVDHDSLRAFNHVMRPRGADSEAPGEPTPEQAARIRAMTDSLHRLHPARLDSVYNGADDDGSGTVGLLEIAQNLAASSNKPKRSLLFVWHTGEELGLLGSDWFTRHPTVPRDSIVAQVNVDMIGRGNAWDLPEGGPGYLQLIGSRRLSTELGELVEAVNRDTGNRMKFDYQFDANGHPDQYYCRSDHYNYARFGIPVVFFSTGGHQDYHQLTDEAQYIDYEQLARVTTFIRDVSVRVANLDHRPVVDGKVMGPDQPCRQ